MFTVRIYTVFLRLLFWLILLPLSPLLMFYSERVRYGFRDYFGHVSKDLRCFTSIEGPLFWIHGVSIGELNAARPVLERLRNRGVRKFYLTSTMPAGIRTAWNLGRDGDVFAAYFPVDLPEHHARLLKSIKPAAIFIMEVDLWPNLIRVAHARGIPVVVLNARISPKTVRFYRNFSLLGRWLFSRVTAAFTQTEADRENLIRCGMRPENTVTAGNVKFDVPFTAFQADRVTQAFPEFQPGEGVLITGGSTHPGEEELLLESARQAIREGIIPADKLYLLLAPRLIKRAESICTLGQRLGFDATLWSRRRFHGLGGPRLLVLDTMGILKQFYPASSLIYIGGSQGKIGGHSVIEGILAGRPLIFGPDMRNFAEVARETVREDCARVVVTPGEVCQELTRLLKDESRMLTVACRLGEISRHHVGAVDRIFECLEGKWHLFLKPSHIT